MHTGIQWNKIKPWIEQSSLLLLMGVLVWFVIRPLHQMITERMDTIQQLDVMQQYRSGEIRKLPELEKQSSLIASQDEDLKLILSREELVSFIQDLERLAQTEGVDIEIVSRDNTLLESKTTKPSAAKEKETASSSEVAESVPAEKRKEKSVEGILADLPIKTYIRLSLTTRGPYANLVRYLAKVESMPYALEVLGMNIREADENAQQSNAFFGDSFVQPAVEPVSAAAPPASKIPTDLVLTGEFDIVVYTQE